MIILLNSNFLPPQNNTENIVEEDCPRTQGQGRAGRAPSRKGQPGARKKQTTFFYRKGAYWTPSSSSSYKIMLRVGPPGAA